MSWALIYTKQEYRQLFAEWVEKEERKKAREEQVTALPRTHSQVSI